MAFGMRGDTPGILLALPWPPSVNHYWRHNGHDTYISAEGILYRDSVGYKVLEQGDPHVDGDLVVDITVFPPDKRRRDLDNLLKSILDSLQKAGVYDDDSQISDLHIVRSHQTEGGAIHVWVRPRV